MADSETGTRTLGLERWVQFAFIAAAVFAFWLLNHIIQMVWRWFAEPDQTLVSASAAIIAIVASYACYRAPTIHQWANEVAAELSKVTWPGRRETWSATVVVLIVTVIAAAILGVFDAAWSAVTDLIYTV